MCGFFRSACRNQLEIRFIELAATLAGKTEI